MKPFLASSKSRLSLNGSVAVTPLRNSSVNVDGGLPFESKCLSSAGGVPTPAPWACAASALTARGASIATAAQATAIKPAKGCWAFIAYPCLENTKVMNPCGQRRGTTLCKNGRHTFLLVQSDTGRRKRVRCADAGLSASVTTNTRPG